MIEENIYKFYPKTKDRIEDEPWYEYYQGVCEVMCAGPDRKAVIPAFYERVKNGEKQALADCKKYLKRCKDIPPDEHLLNWIQGCWLNEETMQMLDAEFRKEIAENQTDYAKSVNSRL